jgi:hypothetical protein
MAILFQAGKGRHTPNDAGILVLLYREWFGERQVLLDGEEYILTRSCIMTWSLRGVEGRDPF